MKAVHLVHGILGEYFSVTIRSATIAWEQFYDTLTEMMQDRSESEDGTASAVALERDEAQLAQILAKQLATLLCRLAKQHANDGRIMVRDSRYVTNTAYSGAESLVIPRFRCTTQERPLNTDDRRRVPRRDRVNVHEC